jgi:hypothetical protein
MKHFQNIIINRSQTKLESFVAHAWRVRGVNFQEKPSIGNRDTASTTSVAQWLRHCATNRKVAGSIPDGVIGIFH